MKSDLHTIVAFIGLLTIVVIVLEGVSQCVEAHGWTFLIPVACAYKLLRDALCEVKKLIEEHDKKRGQGK